MNNYDFTWEYGSSVFNMHFFFKTDRELITNWEAGQTNYYCSVECTGGNGTIGNRVMSVQSSIFSVMAKANNDNLFDFSYVTTLVSNSFKTSNLTSSYTTPNVVEKNRIQRILLKVNIDMELNKSSGITLNDYKKIFTNLPEDTTNIFEDNYQVFYNAEKKYNINGNLCAKSYSKL